MTAGRICSRNVHLVRAEESVRGAAARMRSEHVGMLVVVDADRKPAGVLTDRDIVARVVAEGLDHATTRVDQVMTSHPRAVTEDTPVEEAVVIMRRMGVRRLPVVNGAEELEGVLSLDDVLELAADELESLARIVAGSRPGVTVPAVKPAARSRRVSSDTAGLEKAASDLEC